jgi:hypothetical protein
MSSCLRNSVNQSAFVPRRIPEDAVEAALVEDLGEGEVPVEEAVLIFSHDASWLTSDSRSSGSGLPWTKSRRVPVVMPIAVPSFKFDQ